MHNSRKVFLLPDGQEPRCILAIYEKDEEHNKAPRTEFKTFDPSIEVDQYIVVPSSTRHEMTTCKVVKVDVEVTLDTNEKIDWVIGTIDQTNYLATKKQEQTFIDTVKAAEKAALKKKLKEDMLAGIDPDGMMAIEHQAETE